MAYVNFNRTKPASFALSELADKNTIYFTTDTHEIIINGEAFGTDDLSELLKLIEALAEEADGIAADLNALQSTVDNNAVTTLNALNNLTILVNQNSDDITSLELVIVENELATSTALNNLTILVNQNSENITSLEEVIVENELTTSTALNNLTILVNQNSENITSLEDAIIENELTTSGALNDLNNRLLDTIDEPTIDAMFL